MDHKHSFEVSLGFNQEFRNILDKLYNKYGDEVFKVHGIAPSDLDIVKFSKGFYNKSASSVADVSVDANANIKEKTINQYVNESNKGKMKLNSLYLMYKWVKKIYNKKSAELALERVISGEIFISDLTNFQNSYCFAFSLDILVNDGLTFYKTTLPPSPPKRSDSFINLTVQAIAYISDQILGAIALPDFFVQLDRFYRQEFGEDYTNVIASQRIGEITLPIELTERYFLDKNKELLEKIKLSNDADMIKVKEVLLANRQYFELAKEYYLKSNEANMWQKIKNQFQNFIFSVNFPFKSGQSPFTNLSVLDHGFVNQLFADYLYPDGTSINADSIVDLSKIFFEYFDEINCNEAIFTFPVMTLAVSKDKNNKATDETFIDWLAKANHTKSFSNVFMSLPDSFASCCRLINNYSNINAMGKANTFGVSGLAVGSHRVSGINFPRLAFLELINPNALIDSLDSVHKILFAHRQILNDRIAKGILPLYTSNWMSSKRQYSTVGFVGGHEYIANKGLNITEEGGSNLLVDKLEYINNSMMEWQVEENNIYNMEQIPAESMAVRLAELDRLLGYNDKYELYSNQYLPLTDNANIMDRIKLQGKFDKLTSGGAILHLSANDEQPVSEEIYKRLVYTCLENDVAYFAINYAYQQCEDGHFYIGKKLCPTCKKPSIETYSRIVGFVTPKSSYNKVRRIKEFPNRKFYTNKEISELK